MKGWGKQFLAVGFMEGFEVIEPQSAWRNHERARIIF